MVGLSKGKLRIFIDDCGGSDEFDDIKHVREERVFTMCAVMIYERDYLHFKQAWQSIAFRYAKYLENKELKSYLLRRSNPNSANPPKDSKRYAFHLYEEGPVEYENCCRELKELVQRTPFNIISVSVDKEFARRHYPHKNLLSTVMTNLWERIFIYLILKGSHKPIIIFDPKLNIDDAIIADTYKSFHESGSWFIRAQIRTLRDLHRTILPCDSTSSCGLQLADYAAYPINKYISKGSYKFFSDYIKPKLAGYAKDNRTGKMIQLGMNQCLRNLPARSSNKATVMV